MSNPFRGRGRKDDSPTAAPGADKEAAAEPIAAADTAPEQARPAPARPRAAKPASPGGRPVPQRGQPRLWQELGVPGAGSSEEPADMRQLVIGDGVEVRGNISNCDEVIVEGSADVEITAARLIVRASGRVTGSAHVMEAEVDGVFDGDLTVDGQLAVTEDGSVRGTICYGQLEVGLGGRIIGEIQQGGIRQDKTQPDKNQQEKREPAVATGQPTEPAVAAGSG